MVWLGLYRMGRLKRPQLVAVPRWKTIQMYFEPIQTNSWVIRDEVRFHGKCEHYTESFLQIVYLTKRTSKGFHYGAYVFRFDCKPVARSPSWQSALS